ncbi:kinase-like domain-containing protein [Bisporella sp. PMI_857]|nr:kinase-like domain-containing protein [Bisporella sp. PMI_857]
MVDAESNGLHLDLAPFSLEHIHDYEPGGHHPVHLGDVYGNNGRYRVIHKLGHGGFANVWLSRDTEAKEATKYVVLKILMAEASSDDCPELRMNQLKAAHNQHAPGRDGAESICFPLDHFKIHGPNGIHISFVYPVLGPNVSLGLFRASEDPDNDLRSLSLQVVQAVKFLPSQGICHGDITPNNVLHRISGLDGLNEDEVLQILGSPVVNPALNESKECHYKSTAPEYLVYPVSWWDVDTQFISKESCLIDFGESFEVSQAPDDLGIPGPYRSAELILDKEAGFGSDIWALGCSLFEIRTGRKLFGSFDDEDNDYLDAIVQVLGKLPEPWWSTTWEDRRRMYKDEVDEQGLAVDALGPKPGKDDPGDKRSPIANRHRDISQTEQELFADFLGQLLEYKPEDRISAKDAVSHEWFKL